MKRAKRSRREAVKQITVTVHCDVKPAMKSLKAMRDMAREVAKSMKQLSKRPRTL